MPSLRGVALALQACLLIQPCFAGWRVHDASWTPDYVLVGTAENITTNCQQRYSTLINGTSPGPSLYMKEGQTTWIRVYNNMEDQNLTVHWHGLSQSSAPFSDGTPQVAQWPIAPSEYFDYELRPNIGEAGTYFYHSHVGFQAVSAQGPIIVEDADSCPHEYDDDITLLFSEYYPRSDAAILEGLEANPFLWSGEPEAIAINGRSGNTSFSKAPDETCTPYVVKVKPGQTYRMRFISGTALSLITLGIEDHHELTIIEADGAYTKPWTTDHLQLGSGQRFSLLFKTKSEEEIHTAGKNSFWIRYESRDRPTNVTGYAVLQYESGDTDLPAEFPAKPPLSLPKEMYKWGEYVLEPLNTYGESFPTLSEVTRTVYITMAQVIPEPGKLVNGSIKGQLEWSQNGLVWKLEYREAQHAIPYLVDVYTSGKTPDYQAALKNGGWDPASQAFVAEVGETLDIVWLSNNGPTGGWDFHPMHAHGAHYWDLGSGNGTYDAAANEVRFANYTPAKRDSTMLYRYAGSGVPHTTAGWRAWRMRITENNVGAWMIHCHILAHMRMGMQTVWVFGDTASILAKFPTEPYVTGYLQYGGSAYGNTSYDPLVYEHFS